MGSSYWQRTGMAVELGWREYKKNNKSKTKLYKALSIFEGVFLN